MIKISIEEFAKMYVESNKGENLKDVISQLKHTVKRKRAGATCNICGVPIWVVGSAVVRLDGCFRPLEISEGVGDYEVL